MSLTFYMIYLGADHYGYELKVELKRYFDEQGLKYIDLGVFAIEEQADYPDIAREVSEKVAEHKHEDARGVLIGKSGLGMMLAANKLEGIKAVLAPDVETIIQGRTCYDANVLAMGVHDFTSITPIVDAFLTTQFADDPEDTRCLVKLDHLASE